MRRRPSPRRPGPGRVPAEGPAVGSLPATVAPEPVGAAPPTPGPRRSASPARPRPSERSITAHTAIPERSRSADTFTVVPADRDLRPGGGRAQRPADAAQRPADAPGTPGVGLAST